MILLTSLTLCTKHTEAKPDLQYYSMYVSSMINNFIYLSVVRLVL